ncbi:MAG TPA: hypothetical protein VFD84_00195 [Candidatus Binatia bacterium]|jgi:hypothetical protein|nr:hypothetical protein [Candidatus Binatia bacterium]
MRDDESERGTALTVFATLFLVLAVSNFAKPLHLGAETGFVLFGRRLSGTANLVAGPLFGAYLLVYALGILQLRAWALPMGVLYALYVAANLVLFGLRNPPPPGVGHRLFGAVYAAVALGVSWSAVYLLKQRRLGR